MLQERFLTKSRDQWVDEFTSIDIPFGPVLGIEEALETPHARHREMRLEVDHPVEGRIPQLGFPIKLSETPPEIRTAPPLLGQHTDEILASLGYDQTRIYELRQLGAI